VFLIHDYFFSFPTATFPHSASLNFGEKITVTNANDYYIFLWKRL